MQIHEEVDYTERQRIEVFVEDVSKLLAVSCFDESGISATTKLTTGTASDRSSSDDAFSTSEVSNCSKKSVSFDCVEIREYERELGDNPAVSRGPPITIGWNYVKHGTYTMDEHERLQRSLPRRSRKKLKLSSKRRFLMLLHWSIPKKRIATMLMEINRAKTNRKLTTTMPELVEKSQEILEDTTENIKSWIFGSTLIHDGSVIVHDGIMRKLKVVIQSSKV